MTHKQIEEMSLAERVSTMEALWRSITAENPEPRSPSWHKKVLEQRRRKIAGGKATYLTLGQLRDKLTT